MQLAATQMETWFQKLSMFKTDRDGKNVVDKEGHRIRSQLGVDRLVHSYGHGGPYYYDDPQPLFYKTILVFSRRVPALVEARVLIVNDPRRNIGPGLENYTYSKTKARAVRGAYVSDSDSDF